MTVSGSGWELVFVLAMSSTFFWPVWYFVAQLLHQALVSSICAIKPEDRRAGRDVNS